MLADCDKYHMWAMLLHNFSISKIIRHSFLNCWPKTDRLPDISPAKMGLFGISRELQFRVCSHGRPFKIPPQQGKENAFIQEKTKLQGYSTQRVHGFSLTKSLPGKKRSLSSSCWYLLLLQGMRAPFLVFWICLIEVSVYWFFTYPYFNQDLSLKASLIKGRVFWFQQFFVSQCQEGPFLGVVSHAGGKVHKLETYSGHVPVTKREGGRTLRYFLSKVCVQSRS